MGKGDKSWQSTSLVSCPPLKAKAPFSGLAEPSVDFACGWGHLLVLKLESIFSFNEVMTSHIHPSCWVVIPWWSGWVSKHEMMTVILMLLGSAVSLPSCHLPPLPAEELETTGANSPSCFSVAWP